MDIREMVFDSALYATDSLFGFPLATVTPAGIARDRRLAHLRFSPLRVNSVTGEAILCRSATVTLTYLGADPDRTLGHYRLHHTSAYTVGSTLNRLFTAKDATLTHPLRMVIAVGNGLAGCRRLDDFADWKRSQGMLVDFLYADSIPNFSSDLLADSLRTLYLNATPANPAPLYVILIGDYEQLPAFDNRLAPDNWVFSDNFTPHITDHYFCTWSSDIIRDCYLGRLSATDTVTLRNILDKTLLYERYLFADDSYLAKAVLVAGIDAGDWAYNYADPSMDYIATHYINSDHGFSQVTYGKNNVSINPSAPGVTVVENYSGSTFVGLYNQGMGFVNYSAHGSSSSWSNPYFSVDHVEAMSNTGKPSVMIGNCCLTSHFQTPTCFGEALLRKASAGAVAYIGATNSTYWDDDFFWTVGYRPEVSPSMDLSYNASYTGTYDHLFHLHGEPPAVTIGGILHAGLMSVNNIYDLDYYGPSMVPYYWEIYELMGDPSLLPWMGRAVELTHVGTLECRSNCTVTSPHLHISTSCPGAYVALVDSVDHALFSSAFADERGEALLLLADTAGHVPMLTVTAQQHKSFYSSLRHGNVGIQNSTPHAPLVYPNPVTDHLTIEGLPVGSIVELYDISGCKISISKSTSTKTKFHIGEFPAGLYFLRISSPAGIHTEKIVKN